MNTSLAITISPPNRIKWSGFRNTNRHLYDSDKFIIQAIMKYNRIKDYLFIPEFDIKGRLHYHGICTLTNTQKVRFYKHARVKLTSIGYTDVKAIGTNIKDKLRWLCYAKKHWAFTQQVLEIDRPISRYLEGKDKIG